MNQSNMLNIGILICFLAASGCAQIPSDQYSAPVNIPVPPLNIPFYAQYKGETITFDFAVEQMGEYDFFLVIIKKSDITNVATLLYTLHNKYSPEINIEKSKLSIPLRVQLEKIKPKPWKSWDDGYINLVYEETLGVQ